MATPPTLEQVCEKALRLPCSPSLMPRLIRVLEDVNASAHEIEDLIKMDTALAGSTLRLANSAYFAGGGSKVQSISEAILRLGSREIYRMAALSLAGRWMNQPVKGFHWEPGDFCRRNLLTAVAAEYLAEKSGTVETSVAYTAALIHEIGKLAVAYTAGEFLGEVRDRCVAEKISWVKAEDALLGYNHAQVGAELLRRWNFPQNLVQVAELQPPTKDMAPELLELAIVVHAGKFLAISLGPGASDDGFLFEFNADLLVEHGYTPESLQLAMPEVFAKANKVLGDKLLKGDITF